MSTLETVAGAGPRQYAYSANHPDSPLALAWDTTGPVLVADNMRADVAHAIDRTAWRRAYALGLISTDHGLPADVHQSHSGMFQDETNPADYLARWVETGCAWHVGKNRHAMDSRAEQSSYADRQEVDELERVVDEGDELDRWTRELMSGTGVPAFWIEWASRLVYAPKFEYLVRLGAHAWLGAPAPREPGTAWSAKMGRQWVGRVARCERKSQ